MLNIGPVSLEEILDVDVGSRVNLIVPVDSMSIRIEGEDFPSYTITINSENNPLEIVLPHYLIDNYDDAGENSRTVEIEVEVLEESGIYGKKYWQIVGLKGFDYDIHKTFNYE